MGFYDTSMTDLQVSHRQNINASTLQWHLFILPCLPQLQVPVSQFTTIKFRTQHIQRLGFVIFWSQFLASSLQTWKTSMTRTCNRDRNWQESSFSVVKQTIIIRRHHIPPLGVAVAIEMTTKVY